jgi:ABC-type lipoprotein release transport system permease subunit
MIGLLLRLAARNTARNLRRSLLTAATVLLGTGLITVALAWIDGIFGQMLRGATDAGGHLRVVDADFAAREELAPMYENIPKVDGPLQALQAHPGVTAYPRVMTGAVMTVGEELGDDFGLVMGAPDAWYRDRLHLPDQLLAGAWLSGAADEVVLGRRLAERLGAQPGQELLMLGQTQYGSMSPLAAKVVGVVGGDALIDSQAFVRLDDARWMLDLPEGALEIVVYTPDANDTEAVLALTEALRADPAFAGLHVSPWFQRPPFDSMTGLIGGMRAFIEVLIIFITALAIFNTMTMSVMERTAEIGVMRAMGLSRMGALSLFAVEALIIGLIGGAGGALVGGAAAAWLEAVGVTFGEDLMARVGSSLPVRSTFYADLTPELLVGAVLFGLLIALLGALLPAWRASAIQPVAAMQSRR